MCCKFRVTNWLVAFATFGIGVLSSTPFSTESVSSNGDEKGIDPQITVRYKSKTCIPALENRPFDTERRFAVEDKIHQREHWLFEVIHRNGEYSRRSEDELKSLRLKLEDELLALRRLRDILIQEDIDHQRRSGNLVQSEICYESEI